MVTEALEPPAVCPECLYLEHISYVLLVEVCEGNLDDALEELSTVAQLVCDHRMRLHQPKARITFTGVPCPATEPGARAPRQWMYYPMAERCAWSEVDLHPRWP